MMGFPVELTGEGPLHWARDNVGSWLKFLCCHPKLLQTWHWVDKVSILLMNCVCEMMEFRVELKGLVSGKYVTMGIAREIFNKAVFCRGGQMRTA